MTLVVGYQFWARDHPYITSAKGLGVWVGSEKSQFLLTFNSINADAGWVGQKKPKLDVI